MVAAARPESPVAAVRPVTTGHVNTGYALELEDGAALHLRILSRGPSAWYAERRALARLAGRAPVPEVLAGDAGGGAVGAPWLLTTWLPGDRLDLALARGADAGPLGSAVGEALAAVHAERMEVAGRWNSRGELLPWVAHPVVARLGRWLAEETPRARLGPALADALGELVEAHAGLLGDVQADPRLVHDDFNATNLLVADGTVTGVVDWEWAQAGDPLADLAVLRGRGGVAPAGFLEAVWTSYRARRGDPGAWVRARLDLWDAKLAVEDLKLDATPPPARARARARVAGIVARWRAGPPRDPADPRGTLLP